MPFVSGSGCDLFDFLTPSGIIANAGLHIFCASSLLHMFYVLSIVVSYYVSGAELSAEGERGSPSHVKSGLATSWMGISFRKAGF